MSNELSLIAYNDGKEFPLAVFKNTVLTVGRDEDVNICIQDAGISRNHGQFKNIGERWFYKDLESTNGSYLNSVRLKSKELFFLRNGDFLQLADICLVVRYQTLSPQYLNSNSIIILNSEDLVEELALPQFGLISDIIKDANFDSYCLNLVYSNEQITWSFGECLARDKLKQDKDLIFSIILGIEEFALKITNLSEDIKLNGVKILSKSDKESITLNDRDSIQYKDYRFILNIANPFPITEEKDSSNLSVSTSNEEETNFQVDSQNATPLLNLREVDNKSLNLSNASNPLVNVSVGKDKVLISKNADFSVLSQFGKINSSVEEQGTAVIDKVSLNKALSNARNRRLIANRGKLKTKRAQKGIKEFVNTSWIEEFRQIFDVLFGIFLIFVIIVTLAWLIFGNLS
jgi:FHA domain